MKHTATVLPIDNCTIARSLVSSRQKKAITRPQLVTVPSARLALQWPVRHGGRDDATHPLCAFCRTTGVFWLSMASSNCAVHQVLTCAHIMQVALHLSMWVRLSHCPDCKRAHCRMSVCLARPSAVQMTNTRAALPHTQLPFRYCFERGSGNYFLFGREDECCESFDRCCNTAIWPR